jgi:hypothetical protein
MKKATTEEVNGSNPLVLLAREQYDTSFTHVLPFASVVQLMKTCSLLRAAFDKPACWRRLCQQLRIGQQLELKDAVKRAGQIVLNPRANAFEAGVAECTRQNRVFVCSPPTWMYDFTSQPLNNCGASSCEGADVKQRCGKCRMQSYCNRDCQRAHWKQHKKICSNLTAIAGNKNTALEERPATSRDYIYLQAMISSAKSLCPNLASLPVPSFVDIRATLLSSWKKGCDPDGFEYYADSNPELNDAPVYDSPCQYLVDKQSAAFLHSEASLGAVEMEIVLRSSGINSTVFDFRHANAAAAAAAAVGDDSSACNLMKFFRLLFLSAACPRLPVMLMHSPCEAMISPNGRCDAVRCWWWV